MTALLLTGILMAAVPSPVETEPPRPKHRTDHAGHHEGCLSYRCDRRLTWRAHRATRARWRAATAPYRGWLASTRQCESGGNYGIATGNGFYGAYQFTLSSWRVAGGWGYPHLAEPLEQDYRAVRLLHIQGRGAWPVCG